MNITESLEYKTISKLYGNTTAQRSGVPLINHIDEGLAVLKQLNASETAMKAFCLHPLFQADNMLANSLAMADCFDGSVILLVMEYRKCANAYLCRPHTDAWTLEDLKTYVGTLLPDVRLMLIADKRQNYKDFLKYHYGTHPRTEELTHYFITWLNYLGDEE